MSEQPQVSDAMTRLKELAFEKLRDKHYSAAESACLQYLSGGKKDWKILHVLGVCQLALGNKNLSTNTLRRSIKLAPDNVEVLEALAMSHLNNKESDEYLQVSPKMVLTRYLDSPP